MSCFSTFGGSDRAATEMDGQAGCLPMLLAVLIGGLCRRLFAAVLPALG